MRVRLTRLSNRLPEGQHALRTDSVEGDLVSLFKVGYPLVIEAEPLKLGFNFRQVTTSPVVAIVGNEVWTENTHYRIDWLEDDA